MNSGSGRGSDNGVALGLVAYGLWGIFPLYFRALDRSGAFEVVLHRVLWSLLLCLTVVAVRRAWAPLSAVLRSPRQAGMLGLASVLVAVNWTVYVYAVNSGQVIEASLGYFINPLVTVLLGVVVLHERLRLGQWIAVGMGALAVSVLTAAYGRVPYIALTLACSFGLYGLIKNRVGARVDALTGLTMETLLTGPLCLIVVIVLEADGRGTFTVNPPWQALLLISTGVATVVPLLLFAAAARRVPLSTMGLLQYLTPVLQLLCGVLLLHEHMPIARWIGFGLVWVALVVLTTDTLRHARAEARASRRRQPVMS
jgi:chloramphenicol-sensitive protein RarD